MPETKQEAATKALTVHLTPELHMAVKLSAAQRATSMREVGSEARTAAVGKGKRR